MPISRAHSNRKEWAQYLLLALPTIGVAAYILLLANQSLGVFRNLWGWQTLCFALGLLLSIRLFAFRLRFITLTLVLLGGYWLISGAIDGFLPGEFDAFFWNVRFSLAGFLFIVGWLAGYGFSRSRLFSIIWSLVLLAGMLTVVATVTETQTRSLILAALPLLAYAAYVIYTSELIRNMNEDQTGFGWFVSRRLLSFLGIVLLMALGAMWWLRHDFEAVEKEWAGGGTPREGQEPPNSLTRNDGMGSATNPTMGLQAFNNRANKDSVLFVAKLDHFFPDGKTPNPLYFTSDYYTRFDPETQTFETDSLRPYNDLFKPDPTQLGLYFTLEDTSVLSRSLGPLNRRVATAEVYLKGLSPRHYTAPSTAFFVQPISVPEEDRELYRGAYRAKMLVSDLNSAYFVYNPAGDKGLEAFQEQRFAALRNIRGYSDAPADFMAYYTQMPAGADFDSIGSLARDIVQRANAESPIDQIIAIRDYFLSSDEEGQPLFRYSDNPGIPGLPSANKLCYFLFHNRKGYCAYFAGATLFMLRSLGIPSRIATGFLTIDRSNKNPGWYWFYEDQAHAWVQAWFPGYGWLDFDTTVPSTESQEAPQPDQTPPLTAQTAWLVANGKVISVDTAARRVRILSDRMLYWDIPQNPIPPQELELDISLARILRDTGQIALAELQPDDKVVAVSFSEVFKEMPPRPGEKALELIDRLPDPVPVDEVKILRGDDDEAQAKAPPSARGAGGWKSLLRFLGWTLLLGGLLALLLPTLVYQWLRLRHRLSGNPTDKGYFAWMLSLFYLNQTGHDVKGRNLAGEAGEAIDRQYGTRLVAFARLWQKLKYASGASLNASEQALLNEHYPDFVKQVRKQIPAGDRLKAFLNPAATLAFFTKPNIIG